MSGKVRDGLIKKLLFEQAIAYHERNTGGTSEFNDKEADNEPS